MYIYGGFRGVPLTRWILYGKIRILQRTGRASPDPLAAAAKFHPADVKCRADKKSCKKNTRSIRCSCMVKRSKKPTTG